VNKLRQNNNEEIRKTSHAITKHKQESQGCEVGYIYFLDGVYSNHRKKHHRRKQTTKEYINIQEKENMRKLIAISMIVAGTFASAGIASAADVTLGSYTGWQLEALSSGDR